MNTGCRHVRLTLASSLALVFVIGCDSGAPPLPKPLVPVPLEVKAQPSAKKGKKKPIVDSELDPDSSHRVRRKMLRDAQPKTD